MNTPHPHNHSTPAQSLIDSALRQLGSAQPRPGLNERILQRLRQTAITPAPHAAFWGWPRLGLATLAGCCICAAVVFGSLQHSHTAAVQNHSVVPVLQQQSGVATASSTRVAAHPVIVPDGGGRSNEHPGQGRATVKPGTHVHGGAGIAVPPPLH